MRGVEGNVEQPRFTGGGLANEARRFRSDQIRSVAGLAYRAVVIVPVDFAVALVREVVDRAVIVPVETGEAVRQRQELAARVPQMPFACHDSLPISARRQQLRQRGLPGRKAIARP